MDALIRANGRLSVFEYAARTLLRHELACGDCVAADGIIRPAEAEFVRTIAAVLDTPVPVIAALGTASADALSCSSHLKRSPEAE